MRVKKASTLALLIAANSLLAGEPFMLKKEKDGDFLKTKNELFDRKKSGSAANFDGETNIAIKMNVSQLAFRNISLQGEYGFHKNMSAALGISFLLPRDLPGVFTSSGTEYNEYFTKPRMRGFAITPEFRFYPGGKEDSPAPNGFYVAAYFRVASYTIDQTIGYQEDSNNPNSTWYTGTAAQTYSGFNGGIMLGRQWIVGKHFTFDWWIFGGGYGKAKYTYSWSSSQASLTDQEQADVKAQAEENFEGFSLFNLKGSIETTPKSVKMTVAGLPMFSLRTFGFCFGYAF